MREDYLPEQHGFIYRQTGQGQRVIQRRSIAPPGQGTYYQQSPAQTQRYTKRNTNVPHGDDEYEDDVYPPRQPTSTRRYQAGIYGQPTQVYKQGNRTFVRHKGAPPQQPYLPPQQYPTYTNDIDLDETERPAPKPKRGYTRKMRFHPLVYLGAGMIVMFFLWVLLSYASVWFGTTLDDWHYGRPRTYQVDAVVGHADSTQHPTHFIAVNLNRHVIIIEIPGGDTSKSRIYNVTTLFGDGQGLTPVTLSFTDTKGNGKPDMLIHIQDQHILYHNDGTQFRP